MSEENITKLEIQIHGDDTDLNELIGSMLIDLLTEMNEDPETPKFIDFTAHIETEEECIYVSNTQFCECCAEEILNED